MKLAKSIETLIKDYEVVSVNRNFNKGLVIVKLSNISEQNFRKLLGTVNLNDCEVKCRMPMRVELAYGVIGPIGLDTTDEEVRDSLISDNEVVDVKRLTKGKHKEASMCIKLTFKDNLPKDVKLGFQIFKVRPFQNSVWQCFNCQGFGHNARECRAKTKCVICA